jgi:hypothetical protein
MTHPLPFDPLRRGAPLLLLLLAASLVGCSEGPPQLVLPAPPSGAGSPSVSLGFGGSSAGQAVAGGAGAGGLAGEGGQGGQDGGSGGALPVAGASGSGDSCPLSGPGALSDCDAPKKNSCSSCLCSAPGCSAAWSACQDDSRCAQAAQCVVLGCPSSLCATLAGAAQIKLLPVLDCVSLGCAGACSGPPGTSGAAGEAGQGGDGGGGGAGNAGADGGDGGDSGQAGGGGQAGEGGQAGNGGAAGDGGDGGQGGEAGVGGEGGAAGDSGGGGSGEAGQGGIPVDCEAPAATSLGGSCLEAGPGVGCDPFLEGACSSPDEVCALAPSAEEPSGFLCLPAPEPAALCAPCSPEVPCGGGLACFQGACARLCCSVDDCGPGAQCSPVAFGAGVCLASP